MKKLIVVRHGSYGDNWCLNEHGQMEINKLAQFLKSHMHEESVLILTSNMVRASQSAKILGDILNAPTKEDRILFSDSWHPENISAVLELVNSLQQETDILILVTHFEHVVKFPPFFAKQKFGIDFRCNGIEKGEALVFDCEQRTIAHISLMINSAIVT